MKTLGVILGLLVAVAAWPTAAQERDAVDYDIEVELDAETHELAGREAVRWRNTTGAPTSEIWFHLYLNAFSGSETTFMRGLGRGTLRGFRRAERDWGWTQITAAALEDGTNLLPGLSFERPDDGNEHDFTVAKIELPREVLPGSAVTLELAFVARLPRVIARTGWAGDFYMVGQWFPKVAVFEGAAGWNCHQYHAASEFFADFGSYRVRATIPRGWVIGATGEQISRRPVASSDLVEFRAADVHDFAWTTAPPDLMAVVETDFDPGRDVPPEWLARAQDLLGLGAADLELSPMALSLLVPKSQRVLAPRMVRAARLGIAWFGLRLGPYPQPRLTVVSPPPAAGEAGGMEYPALITTGADLLDAYPPYRWLAGIESVTVHEVGHQYFQGWLASNEFEQAWLDEGLTTWAENECLSDIIGDGLVPEIRVGGAWGRERLVLTLANPPLTIDRRSWDYRRRMDYFLASYSKAAVVMRTLEGLLGRERMARAVRAYYEEHRFSHPTGVDLELALEKATGEDLGWFFDAAVRGNAEPDFAVLAVRQRKPRPAEGMEWRDGAWSAIDDRVDDGGHPGDPVERWRVDVDIGRLGDLVAPVEVELHWADGRSERRRWDGRESWVRFSLESSARLEQVVVDPDGVWALETRRADNYWRDGAAISTPLWWIGHALRLAGQLSLPWS